MKTEGTNQTDVVKTEVSKTELKTEPDMVFHWPRYSCEYKVHKGYALRTAEGIADHKKRLKASKAARRKQEIAELKANLKQVRKEKAELQAKLKAKAEKAKAKKAQTRHVSRHASFNG